MAFLEAPVLYWGMRKVEWVQVIGTVAGVAVAITVAYKRVKVRRKQ